MFASPVPSVRPATKGHIAVLLAVLAALKAADYWVTRYETTNERRGFVQGATYAVVHAQLPALMLLMLIALLTAGLVPVDVAQRIVAAAADRLGAVARRPDRRRPGLPGARAVARRQPQPGSRARRRTSTATSTPRARRWASTPTTSTCAASPFDSLDADDVTVRPRADPQRPPAQPDRDAVAVPHRPRRRGRAVDRRPRRRPLRDRRRAAAGAHRCAASSTSTAAQPELAGPPPDQHPGLRPRDGAGRAGPGERPTRLLQTRRGHPPGAVLQPQPVGLRRRQDRAERAGLPRRGDRGLRRHGRRADVVVRPPGRLRPRLPRLQRARIGGHRGRLADAVGAQRPRPA